MDEAVGWTNYAQDAQRLSAALRGSAFLVTVESRFVLIGQARVVSDDVSIAYIQDVLVHPKHQGRGVGKQLMKMVFDRYSHVRQKVRLTDDRPEQLRFYESLGFTNTRTQTKTPLNAFVLINDVSLN
ncbi:MAG: GNAT family N-acetyltransferase [Bradymonadia bacterium]